MPSFPKPAFPYQVNLSKELKAMRDYKVSRDDLLIPSSNPNNLLLATWNIANLGAQDRGPEHLKLIAEIISWFDLVAVQEVKGNSSDFQEVVKLLGKRHRFIFSDASGNNERMAFIYNSSKVKIREEVAELAIPPADFRHITLASTTSSFNGFDRTPYLVSFQVKDFLFSLLNVHLYFGDEHSTESIERRCLEAYAVARWADLTSNSKYAFTPTIMALGDFNLPKVDATDPVYKALVKRGLQLPEHSSRIYSNISNDKAYDQIAFMPGMKSRIVKHGIFPFDNVLFADMYQQKTPAQFRSYLRYYISDHRPMWMELKMVDGV